MKEVTVTKSKNETPKFISLKVCDALYDLIDKEANEHGVHLIDVVVRRLAESYGRDDLDYVPRGLRGRKPRNRIKLTGKNGHNGHRKELVAK